MEKSQSIKELAKALSIFHQSVGKIKKTETNPFFKSKYAGLPEILEAIAEPLQTAGLMFTQFPDGDSLTTTLIHIESGEYMQAGYSMNPVKNDPQSVGSAITYARRYALGAILGLNIDKDDDGNAATNVKQPEPVKTKVKEELKPGHQKWEGALKSIYTGETTIQKIKEHYTLSQANEQLLINQIQ